MADGERRSAKLSKQSEIDHDEDYPVSTVTTLVTKPGGDVCAPTVLSTSCSPDTMVDDNPAPTKPTRNKTLRRTTALEGTSPPPEQIFSQLSINGGPGGPETGTTSENLPNGGPPCPRGGSSNEAKNFLLSSHEQGVSNDSGRGTFEYTDGTSENEKSLSRTSSTETSSTSHTPSASDPYKDSSGIDLINFFKQTLQKSPKDKKTLFSLEKELHNFVKDDTSKTKKMHEMNPYDRMLVHRLAAHMGMEHNVDQPGKSVIVGKTEFTRIPDMSLHDYFKEIENEGEQLEKKILLKKPARSLDERQSRGRSALSDMKAKSLEERKDHYAKTRERIFGDGSYDECQPPTMLTASPYVSVMVQSNSLRPNLASNRHSQHFKSADSVEPRHQQHSHGMHHLSTQHRRANLNKSKSYEGSPLQSVPVNPACPNLHNTLPDSAIYTSPPPHLANQMNGSPGVADQATTPPTPQSVQPHMNGDGSEYKFDPSNPPPFMVASQTPIIPPTVPSTPPHPTHILHPSEPSVSHMSQPMVAGMPTGVADYPMGQAVSIVPTMVQQQVYPSPSQHLQSQYLPPSPGPGCQQSVRLIAINQGGPTPVEPQSQTTVPMPALQNFTPLVPSPPLTHYHQPLTAITPSQTEEMAASTAYTQVPGGVEGIVNGGPAQFIQGYSLAHQPTAFPSQPAQYIIQQHQGATGQPLTASQTTYYTLPPSSTPPPLLTQPPPSHHQAVQPNPHCVTQQTAVAASHQIPANSTQMTSQMLSVLQSPPAGTTLTYPSMTPHHPQVSGAKTWPQGLMSHPGYRPPSPPAQQMTISYVAPPPAQSQQFVALQPTGAAHQRPLGTLIQLGAAPAGQQYLYRPFTPLQGAALVRPRMQSSQPPHCQQSQNKYKQNGKKKSKKSSLEEEGNGPGVTMVTAPVNTCIPTVSSNRQ